MANYEAYTRNNSDLLADFKKNWEGKISLSQYGQMHYQNYGKKEGRSLPGSSSGGSSSYSVANQGFAGARDNRRPIPTGTPSAGAGIQRRSGGFFSMGGGQALVNADYENQARSSEGTPYYQINVPEGQIIESQSRAGGGKVYGFVDDRGYVYWGSKTRARAYAGQYARTGRINAPTGEFFGKFAGEEEQAAAPAGESGGGSSGGGSSSSSSRPVYSPAPGGMTSSSSVNTQISATEKALEAAINAINAMATGYNTTTTASPFPDAPASVKTYEDYVKWKRSQSASTGFLSTINTGSTGLTTEEAMKNVVLTALTS